MMDKETIKNNFSQYANNYDQYCQVQNLCAARLISQIQADGFKKVLDIVCGTGNYTRLLKEKFPFARIKALDISEGMMKVCKDKLSREGIEFIIADAEDISFRDKFDLISSNAVFQWFKDLKKALKNYKRFLNDQGIIVFSLFGPSTFKELQTSLESFSTQRISLSASGFLAKKQVLGILTDLFSKTQLKEEIYHKEYSSLSDLLKSIKYTGVRGEGLPFKRAWTKQTFKEIERIYRKKFKKLIATYQVFFCQGVK